jgi:hypothetical protein
MRVIITESQKKLLSEKVDPEVIKIQKDLKGKYDLGKTGPNKDGVDGIYGPLTKKAYESEFGKKFYKDTLSKTNNKGFILHEAPEPKDDSFAVVFGGISYANPNWMKQQVPSELLRTKNFLFVPFTSNISDVTSFLGDKKISSVSGFSAGGHRVWPLVDKFNFVGLIDPSTKDSYVSSFAIPSDKVRLMFNDKNWGGKLSYIGKNQLLSKDKMGSSAERVNLGHSKIPNSFFIKYQSRL